MSSTENVKLGSLKLVQDQLVATIEQSAMHLEAFTTDRQDGESLQGCIDGIKQIRGTLDMLQLRGVDLLARELAEQITDIPLGEAPEIDRKLEALSSAFFLLPRYLEYCLQTSRSMAVLLIPHINELRQLRGASPLPESYFYEREIEPIYAGQVSRDTRTGEESGSLVRRLRHMYQVGLVNVLQAKQVPASLGMMGRSMERLESISGGRPLAALWWAAAAAFEALRGDRMAIRVGRKRLFSRLDREIKQFQQQGEAALDQSPDPALIREWLYLIALSRQDTPRLEAVRKAYRLEPLPYSDAELERELEFLRGPSAATIDSMGAVLKDELRSTKNILERAAQGGTELLWESPELLETLKKVADILSVVGLTTPSDHLKREIETIEQWFETREAVSAEALQAVADTLLYIESSVSGLGQVNLTDERLAQINAASREQIIGENQLAEAEDLVLEEAESGLAMIKRALTSYVESNYDMGHIKNVSKTLTTLRGGMTLLKYPRAAQVLSGCQRFVDQALLSGEPPAAIRHMLETFADALISLEYYIDSVRQDRRTDDTVLQVAEEGMSALGYPVEAETATGS